MIKKLARLATAVAALAAFAFPAAASAAEWQFEGKPLSEDATVTLTGTIQVSTPIFGFHSHGQIHITLTPGSTGTVDSHGISNCKGLGGLAGLTCDATAEALPWTIHCNEDGSVTITNIQQKYTYTGTSIVTTLTGNTVLTGEGGSLDHTTLAGENTFVNGTTAVGASGTLEATEESLGYSCA